MWIWIPKRPWCSYFSFQMCTLIKWLLSGHDPPSSRGSIISATHNVRFVTAEVRENQEKEKQRSRRARSSSLHKYSFKQKQVLKKKWIDRWLKQIRNRTEQKLIAAGGTDRLDWDRAMSGWSSDADLGALRVHLWTPAQPVGELATYLCRSPDRGTQTYRLRSQGVAPSSGSGLTYAPRHVLVHPLCPAQLQTQTTKKKMKKSLREGRP